MGIQQFPIPTQSVSIDGSNTVRIQSNAGATNIPVVVSSISNTGMKQQSFRSSSGAPTSVTTAVTVGASVRIVVHSITISQNCTTNNPANGDRLGCVVFFNSGATVNNNNLIATNYAFNGTTNHVFPNGGLLLPAGDDLFICADRYGASDIFYNFTVTIQWQEVAV